MKKITISVILFQFVLPVLCQNLVPNGSFELITYCPNANSQLNFATPWQSPSLGNPDLFNKCANYLLCSYGVPFNGIGWQYPRTGNSMVGIIYALYIIGNINGANEYIEVQLNDSLIQNKTYIISFYINLADRHNIDSTSGSSGLAAIDSMGIYISTIQVYYPTGSTLPLVPQIVDTSGYYADTVNWMHIEGEYTANGGEKYIVIGSFTDVTTGFLPILTTQNPTYIAYYYIDDVAVYPSDTIPPPALAGNDTLICYGDSALIGTHNYTDYYYEWSPSIGLSCDTCGQTWAWPLVTTTYYVTATDFRFVKTVDSVTITVKKCGPNAGMDKAVCFEKPFILGDSLNFNYHCQWTPSTWLNYDTLPMPTSFPLGNITYYLTLMDASFNVVKTDSIYLYVTNCFEANAGKDTSICLGDTVSIGSHNFYSYQYSWQSAVGSQQVYGNISDTTSGIPHVWPDTTTMFYLTVVDSIGNVSYDSVLITVVDCDTLGVEAVSGFGFRVYCYPNPAREVVYLEIAASCELRASSFEIADIFGKVILKEDLEAGKRKYRINISELPAGVYMMRVMGSDMGIVRKVVVVR